MKNEKLLFAAVAILSYGLSQALTGVKLPSGYDVGTVLAWVAGIGALGFVAQFFGDLKFNTHVWQERNQQHLDDLDTTLLGSELYSNTFYNLTHQNDLTHHHND